MGIIGGNTMSLNIRKTKRELFVCAVFTAVTVSASHAAPLNITAGYMDYAQETCSNANFGCTAKFTKVPTGKSLVVTNASCGFNTKNNTPPIDIFLSRTDNLFYPVYLTPVVVGAQATTFYYHANNSVFAVFKAGEIPTVTVQTATANAATVQCTISGQLQ
jgi:hypothetical protein